MLAAVVLALPAGAAAKGGGSLKQGGQVNGVAAQQCAQERSDLGKRTFRKKYGAKHRNADLHQATPRTGRLGAARSQRRLPAGAGTDRALDFLDLYGEDATDSLESALSECVAEAVDELLHPGDYGDDEPEDEIDEE
jgi:hypothetical protein